MLENGDVGIRLHLVADAADGGVHLWLWVCVGVIFASCTPYPTRPARPPTQHMSSLHSPSSSVLLQPHLLSTNLLSHHTLCGVISISSPQWAVCMFVPFVLYLWCIYTSVNVHVHGHAHPTHAHTDWPIFIFVFLSRQPNSHQSHVWFSSSSAAQAPLASAGRGVGGMKCEGGEEEGIDTWCPLSLRTVNLPREVGRRGEEKNLLAGSSLSSKLFISVEKLHVCKDLCKQASTRFWNKTKQRKSRNCQKNKLAKKQTRSMCDWGVFEKRSCGFQNNGQFTLGYLPWRCDVNTGLQ